MPRLDGAASLNPAQNRELMRTLREVLGVRFFLPAFEWMLRVGAFALRTETELILKSRWVVPTRLQEAGFTFSFPTLHAAVEDIVGTPQQRSGG